MRKTVRLLQLPQIFSFDAWCFDFKMSFEEKKMKEKSRKRDEKKKAVRCHQEENEKRRVRIFLSPSNVIKQKRFACVERKKSC